MSFLCVLKISQVFRNKNEAWRFLQFFPTKSKVANSFTHPFYKSKESEQIKQIINQLKNRFILQLLLACNNSLQFMQFLAAQIQRPWCYYTECISDENAKPPIGLSANPPTHSTFRAAKIYVSTKENISFPFGKHKKGKRK